MTIAPIIARVLALTVAAVTLANAKNYYSDPVAGSMSNNGSFASPWADLKSIFAANKTFAGGDTIFLRSGRHGYTIIKGVNTSNVVICPQPGENPIIDRIRIATSSTLTAAYWKLDGLTIQSESTSGTINPSYFLVEIYAFASNITISNCTITSSLNTTGWTRNDWRLRCNRGVAANARLNANHVIENNTIRNVDLGLIISSSSTIVRGNTVQYFTRDGSRVLGSDILFEKNKVLDLMKVMTVSENHDDLFQAYVTAGSAGQDTLKNVIIRSNMFVNTTDTTRQFRGSAQGMGCFDGVFKNWRIENNIVITDHWHGISLYGAENCTIINNTVIDPYTYTPIDPFDNNKPSTGPAWILIDKKTNGPSSFGNIVKNNLSADSVRFSNAAFGTKTNNIRIGALSNYQNYFADVSDIAHPIAFDLHLQSGSPAIDAGDNLGAPLTDFSGASRPQGASTDVGAFEYSPNSTAPSISFTANVQGKVCEGTTITFTASIQNGGNTPTYQWKKNSVNVGLDRNSYTDSVLKNGDTIVCVLTSSLPSANPKTVRSSPWIASVSPRLTPTITLSTTPPSNTICSGAHVEVKAITTYAGSAPIYEWYINGIKTSNTADTLSITTLKNGDSVSARLLSSEVCITSGSAQSQTIVFEVLDKPSKPAIGRIENSDSLICLGMYPTYQWYFNGNKIPNGTTRSIGATAKGRYSVEVGKGYCTTLSDDYNTSTVGDIDIDSDVELFQIIPNSTSTIPTLMSRVSGTFTIMIFDISGKVISGANPIILQEHQPIYLEQFESLTKGVYVLFVIEKGVVRASLRVLKN